MRVKLSYTVEEEDMLKEAAKIIGLSGTDLQQCVDMFAAVQRALQGQEDPDGVVNINKCIELIEDFRNALLNIDTRLFEVQAMIEGYDTHLKTKKNSAAGVPTTLTPLVDGAALLSE